MAKPTLNDAIEMVLVKQPNMTALVPLVRSEIERRDLYRSKDGSFPTDDQIRQQVGKNAKRFGLDGDEVRFLKPDFAQSALAGVEKIVGGKLSDGIRNIQHLKSEKS